MDPAYIAGEGDAFTAITASDVPFVPGSNMATDPDRVGAYQNHIGSWSLTMLAGLVERLQREDRIARRQILEWLNR